MKIKLRHLGLFLILAVFFSAVSGIAMHLHLESSDHHKECEHEHEHEEHESEEHNEENCSVCQHLALLSKQYYCHCDINTEIYSKSQIKSYIYEQEVIRNSIGEVFSPRPPPSNSTS